MNWEATEESATTKEARNRACRAGALVWLLGKVMDKIQGQDMILVHSLSDFDKLLDEAVYYTDHYLFKMYSDSPVDFMTAKACYDEVDIMHLTDLVYVPRIEDL